MIVYYKIMVSAIYTAQRNGIMEDIWKFQSNFSVSTALTFNLGFLYLLFENYISPNALDFLFINFVDDNKYNFLIKCFIYCVLPSMLLNYYFIYKDEKYKILIKHYEKAYSKTIFAFYFILSVLSPIIYILTKVEFRI